jgi:hypothetical protein
MPKPRGITLILVALASLVLLAWRYHSWWLALILFVPALAVAVRRNRPRWWSIHNGYMRCVAAAAGARRGASLPPDPTATARSALALFRQGWESSDVAITLESAQAMMAEASFVESLKAALRRRGPSLAEHDVARFAQRGADTLTDERNIHEFVVFVVLQREGADLDAEDYLLDVATGHARYGRRRNERVIRR